MSGGTLLALTADQVVMDPDAVLGPVDPQIDDLPAASIVKVVAAKPIAQISDDMLVRADVAQKARVQTATFVEQVLLKRLPKERAGPRSRRSCQKDAGRTMRQSSSRRRASWDCRSRQTCRRSSTT